MTRRSHVKEDWETQNISVCDSVYDSVYDSVMIVMFQKTRPDCSHSIEATTQREAQVTPTANQTRLLKMAYGRSDANQESDLLS